MRTEIKIHSSKIASPCNENTSIDEAWTLWTYAVSEQNKVRKQLFENREKLFLDYGNQSRISKDISELDKLLLEAKEFRDARIGSEAWNKKELICSDNLGNELYLENFEVKNYEKRIDQINYFIDTLETKIELLRPTNERQIKLQPDEIVKLTSYFQTSIDKDIFDCNLTDFLKMVENASFENLKIKRKAKVKYLIYVLSKSMGATWYTKTAKSIGVTPKQCSGATMHKNDIWRRAILKI